MIDRPGIGPDDAEIMVCGIGYGREEEKAGKPFIGPSGQLLNAVFKTVGRQREDIFLTNLVGFRPENDDPTQEQLDECRPRLQEEIERVRPKLIIPLGALASEQFTGRKVSQVRGQPLLYDNVLDTSHTCRVMPTWHPAAFLRENGQTYIVDIVRDFAKLLPPPVGVDVLSWPRNHGRFHWELVDSPSDARRVLNSLSTTLPVAIDIETGNPENVDELTMDIHRESLLCFAIAQSDGTTTTSYTFTPEAFNTFVHWANVELGRARFEWVMHYGFFDKQGIKRYLGVDLAIGRDTLARSYALDERQGVHKLKTLAREYTGAGFWEAPVHDAIDVYKANGKKLALYKAWALDHPNDEAVPEFTNDELCDTALFDKYAEVFELLERYKSRRGMSEFALAWYNAELERLKQPSWSVVPNSILEPYNGEDAARTAQLDRVLTAMAKDDGVLEVAQFLEHDIDVNADIAYEGIHVDLAARDDLLLNWGAEWEREHDYLQKWATELGYVNADDTPLNLNSPRQKATFIYDMLGVPLPESKKSITKTGQRTTNIKLLDQVKDSHEWLARYLDFVHLDHALAAYVLPLPKFVREGDLIHPTWKPHAARTFRDSYADPPMHQIPGYEETGGTELQALFDVPSQPSWGQHSRLAFTIHDAIYFYVPDGKGGWWFVAADYSRAEFFVMAYVSGDENLLGDCLATDLHRATAANAIYHKPYDEVTSWERYFAKRFNFGKAYGMQPDTMAKEWLHCPVREARELDEAWNERYAMWIAKTKQWRREAIETGEIVSPITGCKRRFRLILGAESFHELNQAVNFPIQNGACFVTKHARVKLHQSLPTLKDDFFDSASGESSTLNMIHEIMGQQHMATLPGLTSEVKVGRRWSDCHVVTRSDDGTWHFKEEATA